VTGVHFQVSSNAWIWALTSVSGDVVTVEDDVLGTGPVERRIEVDQINGVGRDVLFEHMEVVAENTRFTWSLSTRSQ
jgi:hypothetical protein